MTTLVVLAALAIVIGLVGIVVPVLPGLLLVWGATAAFAGVAIAHGEQGWWLLVAATVLYAVGLTAQYLLPGRSLKSRGIPWTTTLAGVVLAIVGFFVIPVLGAILGFVLGIFLVELARLRTVAAAWPSTVHALKAVGLSMLIELGTGLLVAGAFAIAVASGLGR